jgi:hypothetical protein
VLDGVATAQMSTYQLPNGIHSVTAAACNADGCGPPRYELVDIDVANPKLGLVTPTSFNPARKSLSVGVTLPAASTVTPTVHEKTSVVRAW